MSCVSFKYWLSKSAVEACAKLKGPSSWHALLVWAYSQAHKRLWVCNGQGKTKTSTSRVSRKAPIIFRSFDSRPQNCSRCRYEYVVSSVWFAGVKYSTFLIWGEHRQEMKLQNCGFIWGHGCWKTVPSLRWISEPRRSWKVQYRAQA